MIKKSIHGRYRMKILMLIGLRNEPHFSSKLAASVRSSETLLADVLTTLLGNIFTINPKERTPLKKITFEIE